MTKLFLTLLNVGITAGWLILAACPVAFGEIGVKERVKHVLNYKKPAFWIILTACAACIVVAVCFLTNPKTGDENDAQSVDGTEALEEAGTENAETVSGTGGTAIRRGRNRLLLPSEVVLEWYYDLGIQ